MAALSHEITVILQKFDKEELILDKLLDERIKQENQLECPKGSNAVGVIPRADALKRNEQLLKDLERVKARLRSKAIFTTTEMQWENISRKYQEHPSLLPVKWRCHSPAYTSDRVN